MSTYSKKRKFDGKPGSSKKARKSSYAPTSSVARRSTGMRVVPRQRFGEVKGVDTLLTLTPIIASTNTNGSIQVINLIAPGSGSFNRIGRKAYLKSLRIKGYLDAAITSVAASSDLSGGVVRMVVVWDRQPSSGAIPNFNDIFGVTDQAGTESSTIMAPIRYDNMDRFKILKECTWDFNPEAISPNAGDVLNMQKAFDEYVKLSGQETVFSGQTATQTIADISTGALYIVWRSSINTAGTFIAGVNSQTFARLRYTD